MGGGRLQEREVVVYEGLTLPFLRSTFTSTLNHSSMELVLNTQIAKKLLFQTNLNKIQLFLAQSFWFMTRVDMTIIKYYYSFLFVTPKIMYARMSNGFLHFQVSGFIYKQWVVRNRSEQLHVRTSLVLCFFLLSTKQPGDMLIVARRIPWPPVCP